MEASFKKIKTIFSLIEQHAGKRQKKFPDKPHFIRCFRVYKLEKYPLTCDFLAKIRAKYVKISENIVQC
jgi:hypothetical protein